MIVDSGSAMNLCHQPDRIRCTAFNSYIFGFINHLQFKYIDATLSTVCVELCASVHRSMIILYVIRRGVVCGGTHYKKELSNVR